MKTVTCFHICVTVCYLLFWWNVENAGGTKTKRRYVLTTNIGRKNHVQRRGTIILANVKLNLKNIANEGSKNGTSGDKHITREKLHKIKKLENVNKYNLKIYKLEIKDLEIRTRQLLLRRIELTKQQIKAILKAIEQNLRIVFDHIKNIKWEKHFSPHIHYVQSLNNIKKKLMKHIQELDKRYQISYSIQKRMNSFVFLNKTNMWKIGNYGSVNLLFLLFTVAYFSRNPLYAFLKKNYAFIGEFKNIKTEQFIKIYTLSAFLFFFYKFGILRMIYIFNSFNVLSKKVYLLNSLVHFFFYSHFFLSPYFLIRSNWGTFYLFSAETSKFLGRLFLVQLLLIISRIMCMNFDKDFTYITKWKDEEYFNRKDFMQNLKNDKRIEFYVDLLNRFPFIKRMYVGNNKFYEALLYLHKYKYVLDFLLPVNNLFYIYIAHSLFLHLSNLSYGGIYLSVLSFILLLFQIFTKQVDTYYLMRTR